MNNYSNDIEFASLSDQDIEAMIANGEELFEDFDVETDSMIDDWGVDEDYTEDELIGSLSFSDSHYWD